VLIVSFGNIFSASQNPYRQISALQENQTASEFNERLGRLKLSTETSARISEMLKSMKLASFKPGTHTIDFSGQSPTVLFIARARPVGDSWLIGGYTGSDEFAIKKLASVNCHIIRKSWLLIENGGPRSLDYEIILSKLGLEFVNYTKVASWKTPQGAGGYIEPRIQLLYKPNGESLPCKATSFIR
jgi:hypothetical protein